MVERIAHDDQIPLEWMDVSVESYRDPDKVPGELSVYDDVRVHFQMWGLDDDQGQFLVDTWKRALTALRFGRRGDPYNYCDIHHPSAW